MTTPPASLPERFPEWRSVQWPNGARVAVLVTLAFESFEQHSQFTTEAHAGVNPFSLSYGEYGARSGAWRLMAMLEDVGVRASVGVSGQAAERHPEVLAALAARGHELTGHGWVNDQAMPSGDAGREVVARSLDAIEAAAGVRPVGWISPGKIGSPDADEILLDAGLIYSGDDASDDLPFVRAVGERRIAVIPSADLASNDLLHWGLRGQHPDVLLDGFRMTFDAVYEEAMAGRCGMIGLVLHSHTAGRPTLIPAVRELLRDCARHEGVWFTTPDELARLALDGDWRR